MMTDNDSPWKELLEQELPLALAFFFPAIHAGLDWSHDHENLEQELRTLYPTGETGKRIADCLVKAVGTEGDVRYLHGEVQGGVEEGFPRRMHVYNYRAEDRFGQPVGSFAILIDDDPKWLPDRYESQVCGTTRTLTYPVAKILGWRGKEAELRTHANPVALFVLAQLASMRTKKDDEGRAAAKLEVILLLQERGMTEEELRHWYRYLDWLLALPKEYDRGIWLRVRELKEKVMPFVTFAERYGMEQGEKIGLEKGLEKGIEQGMEKGIEKGLAKGMMKAIEAVLDVRFPDAAPSLMTRVMQVNDIAQLQRLLQVAKTAPLAEIEVAVAASLAT